MKIISLLIFFVFTNYANAQKMTQEDYLEKGKYIWQNFVPTSGQSEFVQGELLRAIEKLRDEAQRNGNGNFHKKCHGALITYLKKKLSDNKLFDKETIKKIKQDLDKLNNDRKPYLEDDIYDYICDRIVDWSIFYGEDVKHINNADLQC
ncbi:hypothetical protein [Cellulophaga tyrosinoxydans]|nr:hypothetical protein [Cellulophaga tyrosinoxydans]